MQINPPQTYPLNASICAGSSYNFNGQNLTQAGAYSDTLTGVGGCDSIVVLQLQIIPPISSTLNASICTGSTYNFNGQQLDSSGVYTDTLITGSGCDSIVSLHLQVLQQIVNNFSAAICQGQLYNFAGQLLDSSGIYIDTLIASGGCDSILILNLQVATVIVINDTAAICQGNTYNFNGQVLDSAGVYSDTLISSGGCDSVVNLYLRVNNLPVVSFMLNPDTLCNRASAITLSGGSPAGGIYSGPGVTGDMFPTL